MKEVTVEVVDYNLFEYEKEFLLNEIKALGGKIKSGKVERNSAIVVIGLSADQAKKLTFVKGIKHKGCFSPSTQSVRESFNGKSARVQSRRYGPHGLHEYKGRFNPQTPRSLILGHFPAKSTILDPFMGSGTTLIEARDLGYKGVGIELNPLAHLIAVAKKTYEEIPFLGSIKWNENKKFPSFYDDDTREYLLRWFPKKKFEQLELIQHHLKQLDEKQSLIAKVVLSNLLREHSYQDPKDLRIRRRKYVPESPTLVEDFRTRFEELSKKHNGWIKEFGIKSSQDLMLKNLDSRELSAHIKVKVDGSVCSPPYATALPYIDTYRLSMIALGLIKPTEILKKEKGLIGSRDVSTSDKQMLESHTSALPNKIKKVLKQIQEGIANDDSAGFRKQATPHSFARYYFSMLSVLEELYSVEREGAQNLWVLGPNRVKLGGKWLVMDTPELVGELARKVGFKNVSVNKVQAYNRYGLHSKNSISQESILKFQK